MVDTPKKRFVIPMPPYQTIDAGVHARAGMIVPKLQQPNVTRSVSEMDAAQGLLNLQKKGGRSRRNRTRRSRKSRRRR